LAYFQNYKVDYTQCSDDTLLQQIGQGDAAALAELFDRYAQIMYNLIARLLPDPALADEILQETFWQVWQEAGKFSTEGSVAAWLFGLARRKSLEQLRYQKLHSNLS
jgi:RNA polymerase sigma-70 factor (ECF subfamily)